MDFFEKRVRPILADHCYECHNAEKGKTKGGLNLAVREGWVHGGDSGTAIVPGKPDDSLLVTAVRYWDKDLQMPPKKPLQPAEVNDLIEWVKLGAPDPRTGTAVVASAPAAKPGALSLKGADHWAFQPVHEQKPPTVQDRAWLRDDVDAFTLAKMEAAGVKPALDADRRTLIRRVTFDLIGLPPTPEEVQDFLNDPSPDAFARVVDRLLASPRYGERWGRHWLDLVRYADTCGNASDYPVPQAYKYRDYVIRAFNDDMPYDRFIREQVAGDLLPESLTAGGPSIEPVVATGYLASARRFGGGEGEPHLTIEDTIDNLGHTFLGLSLNCARCHDHKFDPIANTDYYALYGVFSSTVFPHPGSEGKNRPEHLVPLLPKPELEAAKKLWQDKLAALDAEAKTDDAEKVAAEKQPDSPERKAKIDAAVKAAAAAREQRKILKDAPPYELAYAVSEGTPGNARLQVRGDPKRLGDEVPRHFLTVLGGASLAGHGSGRLELANALADAKNPLTARVLVNRLWQYHFGRGLVTTPNDFGTRGLPPTNPELLDFLARKFVEGGWSIKSMHRLLLLSHTWQLSSEGRGSTDPENKLWSRAERRRLDAESIRDALLFVSGTLDLQPGAAHPFPPVHTWSFTQHNQFFATYDTNQRSVYQMQQRLRRHAFLGLFDGSDPNSSTALRQESTTPLQSLFMMNDKFVHERAKDFSTRLTGAGPEDTRRIETAFLTLYARPPQPEETQMASEYLAKLVAAKLPPAEAWQSLSRALLGANEFLYLD